MIAGDDRGRAGRAHTSSERRAVWLRRAGVVLAGAGVTVLLLQAVDGPADPFLAPAGGEVGTTAAGDACADDPAGPPLEGFGEVTFTVLGTDGSTVVGCALLADTPEARGQGLMRQPDLGGYDAMVFRYGAETSETFYMFDTPLPLSIAFIGTDGAIVSTADMDPCPATDASACPTYAAAGPYLHAVEVARGDLPRLGIAQGATVTFGSVGAP